MNEGSKDIRDILETPIEYYFDTGWISTRAFNLCQFNDILTMGDLIQYHHKKGLVSLRNCGKKSLEELSKIIASVNYSYALQVLERQDYYGIIPEAIRHLFEEIYRNFLSGYSESFIEQFNSFFERPEEFFSFFCIKQHVLADRFHQIKTKEIKQYCYKLLVEVSEAVKKVHLDESYFYELIITAKTILWFCNDPFAKDLEEANQVVKAKKKMILADFAKRKSQLSKKTIRVLNSKTPTYLDIISVFQFTESQWEDCYFSKRLMKETSNELYTFLRESRKALFHYENLEKQEIIKKIVLLRFPFLISKECYSVSKFYNKHGHYPMFYILQQYLSKTKNKAEQIFADYSGIIDGQCKSQAEIAESFGMTRERIRQILKTASKKLFKDEDWKCYGIQELEIMIQEDAASTYQFVINNEITNISFKSFSIICSLGFGVWMESYNGVLFLINNRFDRNIINPVCRKIEELQLKKRYKEYHFQLKTYLSRLTESEKESYKKLLLYIINKAYCLEPRGTGRLVFPKTNVNVVDELCEILRKGGRPMAFKELYNKLQERNIGIRIPNQTSIRHVILHSKKIKAIGKSSRYSLAEWNDVYWGSIRGLVAEILQETDEPLCISDIMPEVWKIYPNTSKRSVSSSIRASEKFVSFGFGYFGLAEKEYKDFVPKREPKKASTRTKSHKDKEAKTTTEGKKSKEVNGYIEDKTTANIQTNSPSPKETNHFIKEYKSVQQNETQFEFQRKCRQYLEFVLSHTIPTPETNQYLFQWFNEVVTKIDELEEKKRIYFEEMVAVLRKRGISI